MKAELLCICNIVSLYRTDRTINCHKIVHTFYKKTDIYWFFFLCNNNMIRVSSCANKLLHYCISKLAQWYVDVGVHGMSDAPYTYLYLLKWFQKGKSVFSIYHFRKNTTWLIWIKTMVLFYLSIVIASFIKVLIK